MPAITTMAEPRAKTEQAQRRRRKTSVQSVGRLGLDPALLDHGKFRYRWVNDAPGRLVSLTGHDDWDFVEDNKAKEDNADLGSRVSIVVGVLPDGSPMRAYLCRKPRTFYDEDQKEAQAKLDEELNQLARGANRQGELQSDYVPNSGIRLGR